MQSTRILLVTDSRAIMSAVSSVHKILHRQNVCGSSAEKFQQVVTVVAATAPITAMHGLFNHIWQVVPVCNSVNDTVPWTSPPDYVPQTAPQSVQLFLHSWLVWPTHRWTDRQTNHNIKSQHDHHGRGNNQHGALTMSMR